MSIKKQCQKQAEETYTMFLGFCKYFSYYCLFLLILLASCNWGVDGTGGTGNSALYDEYKERMGVADWELINSKARENVKDVVEKWIMFMKEKNFDTHFVKWITKTTENKKMFNQIKQMRQLCRSDGTYAPLLHTCIWVPGWLGW